MAAKGICLALLLVLPVVGQTGASISERISKAPLTPEERQAVVRLFSQKQFDRLETLLGSAASVAGPPERTAALRALLGALEFLGGRMQQAVEAFEGADALTVLDDRDRFTLAMALVELGDIAHSRVELTRLNETHPDQPLYLYWLARLDYGQRRYDSAIDKLNKVVQMDPGSVRGYDNLGLSYDMMGLAGEAQNAFSKAVLLNRALPSPSPWPPHNLGYLQLRLQHFREAEKSLREALKYDPRFATAHYYLARALEGQGQDNAAIEEYKSAAALDASLAAPLYSLGLLYRRMGSGAEADKAFAEFRRRKALSPDSQ